MKINKIMYFILVVSLLLVSCKSSDPKFNPLELCSKFYELNKNSKFNGLFNVHILGVRDNTKYNDSINKYDRIPAVIRITDSISQEYVQLPAFSRNADSKERKLFFDRLMKVDLPYSSGLAYLKNKYNVSSKNDLFRAYVNEFESIYSNYYKIKVPNELGYTNIQINGYNDYIKFTLYKNEEKRIEYSCYYYAKDTLLLKDREFFNKLHKFDNHWYYDLGN